MLRSGLLPLLIMAVRVVSGCASSPASEPQRLAQATTQQASPACPSKWVAGGNNGAKAGRYFQVSC
jgi:hypothetical protein